MSHRELTHYGVLSGVIKLFEKIKKLQNKLTQALTSSESLIEKCRDSKSHFESRRNKVYSDSA